MGKHVAGIIPVAAYDRGSGELINVYRNASVAARRLGLRSGAAVVQSCRKIRGQLTLGDYVFRFAPEEDSNIPTQIDVSDLPSRRGGKPIMQIDKKNNIITIYESISEASKHAGMSTTSMAHYIRFGIKPQFMNTEEIDWRFATKEDITKYGQIRRTNKGL